MKRRRDLSFIPFLQQARSGWELDGCGNSGLISKSSAALKEIEKISAATNKTGGIISGEVWLETGVTVITKGNAGTFRGTSDTQGQFHIHVPAGFYSVRAMQRGARFAANDLSYELPRKLYIQNGGCAQISFDRVEPGEVRRRSERLPGR